jgi:hypothetical protein
VGNSDEETDSLLFLFYVEYQIGLPLSEKKKYSADPGIDENCDSFRRNSVCVAEWEILGIPFRTIPRKIKMLGIPFRTIS